MRRINRLFPKLFKKCSPKGWQSLFWPESGVLKGHNMWIDLAKAVCLMLVLEGIIPFLYPRRWRNLVAHMALINDRQLRIMGLVSMAVGVIVLTLIKSWQT